MRFIWVFLPYIISNNYHKRLIELPGILFYLRVFNMCMCLCVDKATVILTLLFYNLFYFTFENNSTCLHRIIELIITRSLEKSCRTKSWWKIHIIGLEPFFVCPECPDYEDIGGYSPMNKISLQTQKNSAACYRPLKNIGLLFLDSCRTIGGKFKHTDNIRVSGKFEWSFQYCLPVPLFCLFCCVSVVVLGLIGDLVVY